jgi:oligo-1,6-glucosidase
VNVQTQDQAADSLLNTYRTLIQLRADHPALSIGSYIPVQSKNTGVYAFLRTLGSDTYLILVNLTKNPLSDYSISGAETGLSDGRYAAAGLMDEAEAKDLVLLNGGFSDYKPVETLQAYTGYVFNIHKK